MSTAFEIAKRISFQKQKNYTRFIVRLSIAATAISVAAILLTFSIVNGFQATIANKVYQFWGHIRVASVSGEPMKQDANTLAAFQKNTAVKNMSPFVSQSTVLSFDQDIEGLVARGIPASTQIPFLRKGKGWTTSAKDSMLNEIIISDNTSKKLNIQLGATVRLYFLNTGAVQQRKLKVVGIYHSGIEEYDNQFVLVDIKLLHQLNNNELVEGYSIVLNENASIETTTAALQKIIPENWVATSIKDYYPQIFDWIGVQTINRNVTITIMLIVAIINLLTCLFIIMLERITMIGTLTALGASQNFIRKIFLFQASFICWTGILLGAIIGLGLSYLQAKTGWIQMDESAYFIKELPIKMDAVQIISVLIGTAIISYVSFLLPTLWIKKISPAKAIQFD
ncbi:MAG: ABC transporter permease [Chitinophagaceae bacterium]|nr:ABC transporter permease [Chitinophagaceae bacterium]